MANNRRRAAHALLLAVLAVALACSAGELTSPAMAQGRASAPGQHKTTDTTTVTPPDTTTVTATVAPAPIGCPATYTRLVNVSTATQLSSALANAQPGDQIRLASATYLNTFTVTRSGTASAPITLCGPVTAVLTKGTVTGGGFALVMNGASWWRVLGLRVTNAQQGIHLLHASHNTLAVTVDHVGQEAIHLAAFSSHNEVRASTIHDTGLYLAQYGEGVYVGSAPTQWCQWSSCGPDRSDSNRVVASAIGPNIASDPLDVKAGTIGTVADSNTIDARGSRNLGGDQNWEGGLAIINGQHALLRWNRGSGAAYHGFSVQNDGGASAYPASATFVGNVLDLSGTSGYGFLIGYRAGGTVYCAADAALGNHVSNSTKFANVACAP